MIVAVDDGNLVVTYETRWRWRLTETHLYVGTAPPTESNPGSFPYQNDNLGDVTSDQYSIPLSDLGAGSGDTLYIAAHAVVRVWMSEWDTPDWWEETGWTCGWSFGKGWAKYFPVDIPCRIP